MIAVENIIITEYSGGESPNSNADKWRHYHRQCRIMIRGAEEHKIPRTNFYKSVIIVIIIHFVKLTHNSPLEWSVHKYCGLIRL